MADLDIDNFLSLLFLSVEFFSQFVSGIHHSSAFFLIRDCDAFKAKGVMQGIKLLTPNRKPNLGLDDRVETVGRENRWFINCFSSSMSQLPAFLCIGMNPFQFFLPKSSALFAVRGMSKCEEYCDTTWKIQLASENR